MFITQVRHLLLIHIAQQLELFFLGLPYSLFRQIELEDLVLSSEIEERICATLKYDITWLHTNVIYLENLSELTVFTRLHLLLRA